ncbi:MAG TPA: hypothetical protein VG095_03600, partial [Chthoniobacterales bacterium]|nr:hypothetical protein [Chthoniobacterales bacterium]
LKQRPDALPAELAQAEELLQRALALDPTFALAQARLSILHSWRYHTDERSLRRMERARAAAMEALRLDPSLPETHHALGLLYYWVDRDYEKALRELAVAREGLPNNADTYLATGAIERRQGKWQQSTANMEKAASLGPNDVWVLDNLAANYAALRRYDLAEQMVDRALQITPDSAALRAMRAMWVIEARADLDAAEQILARAPAGADPRGHVTMAKASVAIWKRDYARAIALLQPLAETAAKDAEFRRERAVLLGVAHTLNGETREGRAAFEEARVAAESALQQYPLDPKRHAQLGYILAWLGMKEPAVTHGRRATEMLPESKDALDGPKQLVSLAQIYALNGEHDQAFAILARSLTTPAGITPAMLQLDPVWDQLRSDPRFAELLTQK